MVLSVSPFIVIPAPSAVKSVGESTFAIIIFLSSIVKSAVFSVVVVPSTYKLPNIVKFPPTFT
jgi:hypothetical protein